MNRIVVSSTTGEPLNWVSPAVKITGEPFYGRKGNVSGVDGNYWVYGTPDPVSGSDQNVKALGGTSGGPTHWSGTGPLFLVSNARVGGASRASIEVTLTPGSTGGSTQPPSNQWNIICETNPTATAEGGHSEGPALIGNNWNGNYEICQHNFSATVNGDNKIGLYMGGTVSRASEVKKLFNGNNAYIGGKVNQVMQMNGGGQVINTFDQAYFDSEWAKWENVSSELKKMAGVAINTSDMNNLQVNVSANTLNGKMRVFTIPDSQLKPLRTINFNNMAADDTVIINVSGSNVDWGLQVNAPYRNRILWNLPDVVNINVEQRNWTGLMLAPEANVLQYQNIQGTMVCKNWNTFGAPEMHFTGFKFAGTLPGGTGVARPTTVVFKGSYDAIDTTSKS
jgi:choice-of-anchor A domain-containing protein